MLDYEGDLLVSEASKNPPEFYTGEKGKNLLVHVVQDGVCVSKPIKTKIWRQEVAWKQRIWPIVPAKFWYDEKGLAHQMVDANDVSVLSFNKDHEEKCRKCGGKMTIDAKTEAALVRRKRDFNLWGTDNNYFMMIVILAIFGMMMLAIAWYESVEANKANQKYATLLENINSGNIPSNGEVIKAN